MDPSSSEEPTGDSTWSSDVRSKLLDQGLFRHSLQEVHVWELERDADGNIVTWRLVDANPAAERAWQRKLADVVGQTPDEIFGGYPVTELFLPIVREIFETGRAREWKQEFPPTGEVLHMVSAPYGEFFMSTGLDVADADRHARILEDALRQLRRAISAGGVGLWDWDLTTDEVRFSDEWKRQLGYEPHEIPDLFSEWERRVHPDDMEATRSITEASVQEASQDHVSVFRMRHRDGSDRWILSKAAMVLDDHGTPVRMLGSHIDITERRRLEERVVESQKLESMGTLAAGMAHDFNNMLTAIVGNVSLLQDGIDPDSEDAAMLVEIEQAALSAQGLTSRLLTFAKGDVPELEPASIGALIRDCALLSTRGSAAVCEVHVARDLSVVEVDVAQISQVINNLVINAVQAMGDKGGRIWVGASNVTLRAGNGVGLSPGPYLKVSVKDEGPGIPRDRIHQVFDLFFSTKPNGSGLGLSTAHSIARKHRGRITVESQLGRGATFILYLPATAAEVREKALPVVVPGSGRILVMDDQESVRMTVRRMLGRLGYECDVVADGDQALAQYLEAQKIGRPYDLVILDLTVPGRPGGREAVKALKVADAEVKTIVSSGYSDNQVLAEYDKYGFNGRLRKPMTTAALSQEIARVLESPA